MKTESQIQYWPLFSRFSCISDFSSEPLKLATTLFLFLDVEPRLVKSIGQNSALPTYVVALFDKNKKFISKSVGESPFLAAEDAARVALQSLIKLKIE